MDILKVRERFSNGNVKWTVHGLERMQERDISKDDVRNCIMNGEIIEDYPDDFPLPSALIFGISCNSVPLHVVCGMNEENIFIISAYFPTAEKFGTDFRTRRK